MELIPVSERADAVDVLYELLVERESEGNVNISHASLPSLEEHRRFVENHPYQAWYIIVEDDVAVGSIYLTQPPRPSVAGNEIGIFIFQSCQGRGIASEAIAKLMNRHGDGPYFANINPKNYKSMSLFMGKGFELIQFTLKKRSNG